MNEFLTADEAPRARSKWWGTGRVAERYGVSRSTIWRWCKVGLLRAVQIQDLGQAMWLIDPQSLEEFDKTKLGKRHLAIMGRR